MYNLSVMAELDFIEKFRANQRKQGNGTRLEESTATAADFTIVNSETRKEEHVRVGIKGDVNPINPDGSLKQASG